jgi:hypothetical protein
VQLIRNLTYEPVKTDKEAKREHLQTNDNAADVLKHGYADGNEITFLFVAMLRAAGLDATIVSVTSRENSVFDPNVMDATQLDAKVVVVHIDNRVLLLDPATHLCPYGLLPWGETGIRGLQLRGPVLFFSVPSPGSDAAITKRTADLNIDSAGNLAGNINVSFSGQEALSRRLAHYDEDQLAQRQALAEEIRSWLPLGATVEIDQIANWDDENQDLKIKCRISVPQFAQVSGRRMLLTPAIFLESHSNLFQRQTRHQAINFKYPYQEVDTIRLTLPDDYSVSTVPDVVEVKTEFSTYRAEAKLQSGVVDFQRTFTVNGFYFPPSSYLQLKGFFDAVKLNDGRVVVLAQGSAHDGP